MLFVLQKSNLDILYNKRESLSDRKLTLELEIKFLEIDLLKKESCFKIHKNLKKLAVELSTKKKTLKDNICEQCNVSNQIKSILALNRNKRKLSE